MRKVLPRMGISEIIAGSLFPPHWIWSDSSRLLSLGVAVLVTRNTETLVRYGWLEPRNPISDRWGVQRPETCPACARFKSGDGCSVDVRCATDISAGIDGGRGKFAAFAPEADIPGLSRKGALEALEGQ